MKRILATVVMFLFVALMPMPANATSPFTQVAACASDPISNIFGFQPWYACLQKKYGDTGDKVQIKSINDIFLIIFPVVDWIIKASVLVAAGMIFYMLFLIATSRGNASQYGTAIAGIRDAIIGLCIAMLSVAILEFVAGAFT